MDESLGPGCPSLPLLHGFIVAWHTGEAKTNSRGHRPSKRPAS